MHHRRLSFCKETAICYGVRTHLKQLSSFIVFTGMRLYLFGCRIDGSRGMNVGDLRVTVGWWDSVRCGLSSGAVLV